MWIQKVSDLLNSKIEVQLSKLSKVCLFSFFHFSSSHSHFWINLPVFVLPQRWIVLSSMVAEFVWSFPGLAAKTVNLDLVVVIVDPWTATNGKEVSDHLCGIQSLLHSRHSFCTKSAPFCFLLLCCGHWLLNAAMVLAKSRSSMSSQHEQPFQCIKRNSAFSSRLLPLVVVMLILCLLWLVFHFTHFILLSLSLQLRFSSETVIFLSVFLFVHVGIDWQWWNRTHGSWLHSVWSSSSLSFALTVASTQQQITFSC